ncbi:HEXXH motif-containing putative peptide modification protein [Aquimarina sp. MMG016]|uniref:aKG-HExxH-type peptide beta-hydroxylase n=1 Tax=Aquimarina sp. MMG016 TaxID=2822690 RepID=UPI001B3A3593|nr:HEXXH motif-containing putative peptide modification protein [Aquimarina sp. MMG016]MBQ4822096.1 hypothetical protein [Aquimarina sp. MMG016]
MEVKERYQLKAWEHMAVPQSDGSDTKLFLEYAKNTNLQVTEDAQSGEPRIFNNKVALRHLDWDEAFLEKFEHAPFTHPSIQEAEALIALWPEVYDQCSKILKTVNPMLIKGIADDKNYGGSNSHQPENTLGAVWATVHNPVLLAQALVHEMAHNKLFSLGQHFESTAPLFTNGEEEVFDSPVRLDIPRPISAVFHGVYAFTHVLALDRILFEKSELEDKKQILGLLHFNALRVKKGAALIRKCAKLTDNGEAFVDRFLQWAEDEVTKALEICKANIKDKEGAIVLIGPDSEEKFNVAEQLSQKFDREVIHASDICWDIWAESAVVTRRKQELYGSSEVMNIFKKSQKFSNKEFLHNWMRSGVLYPEEVEFMQLQLSHYLLTNYPNAVICLGEDHTLIERPDFIKRLQRLFNELHTKVIYACPVLRIDDTIEKLDVFNAEERKKKLQKLLFGPANRTLSAYVFDTNTSDKETIEDLLELLKIS